MADFIAGCIVGFLQERETHDMTDENRVVNYVESYFQRSGRTKFPTVRQIAHSLNLKISTVFEFDGFESNYGNGLSLMLTHHNHSKNTPMGDYTLETL